MNTMLDAKGLKANESSGGAHVRRIRCNDSDVITVARLETSDLYRCFAAAKFTNLKMKIQLALGGSEMVW